MATNAALGMRRAAALARIEARCETLAGAPLRLPTASRHGPDHLLVLQLELIADHLENAQLSADAGNDENSGPYDGLTHKALVAQISERGLKRGYARSKTELIDILTAADQAAEAQEGAHAQVF